MNQPSISDITSLLSRYGTGLSRHDTPDLVPYGWHYALSVYSPNNSYSALLKYNIRNYSGDELDPLIQQFMEREGYTDLDCVDAPGMHLLTEPVEDRTGSYGRNWKVDDRGSVSFKGSEIRYRKKGSAAWRYLTDDWVVILTPTIEWKDPKVDEANHQRVHSWLADTKMHIVKSQAILADALQQVDALLDAK